MTSRTLLLALALSTALAPAAFADGDKPMAATSDPVAFVCGSGNGIVVTYDRSDAEAPVAHLEYLGRTFELRRFGTGPDERFSTEQGLAPDRGLQWWPEGGPTATLREMVLDHTAGEPTILESCTPTEPAAAAEVDPARLPLGSWKVTAILGSASNSEVESTLNVGEDGGVGGNGGCNTFGGQASTEDGGLQIRNVFSTMMMCEGGGSEQESVFFRALESTAGYRMDGADLVLLDAAGAELVRLSPVSA